MKKNVVVRAIIVDEGKKKVLLGIRKRGYGADQWALIGGKPEKHETEEEAIVREVKEELAVEFEPAFWFSEIDKNSIEDQTWNVYYFEGMVFGDIKIKKDELGEVKYFSRNEIGELDLAFDHKDILLKYFSGKKWS